MSGAAEGKEQIAAQVTISEAELLFKRAERLGWKRGKYVGAILKDWFARGCPPVSDMERALALLDSKDAKGETPKVKSRPSISTE